MTIVLLIRNDEGRNLQKKLSLLAQTHHSLELGVKPNPKLKDFQISKGQAPTNIFIDARKWNVISVRMKAHSKHIVRKMLLQSSQPYN